MGDFEHTQDVDAPASALFDYLADVAHLPDYFPQMTSATKGDGEAVYVEAEVDGRTEHGEAWFRVDSENRTLAWGSESPNDYHGELEVAGDDASSSLTISLHTEHTGSTEIDDGIVQTLARIGELVERGPAPGPTDN